jgi:DNA-binding CsgD family transcriptional regulator
VSDIGSLEPIESLLDLWHIGVVAFSESGGQVYANRTARQLASACDGLSFTVEGPVAATATQTRTLRKLVRQLADNEPRRGPEWLRLSRPSGAAPYEVILCRAAVSPVAGAAVMMFVAAPEDSIACDRVALRRLYRLTDLEASVAECVGKGMPMSAIAAALNLSLQTTRWYVRQVREKMGAQSQGHLIRIMLRGLAVMDWASLHHKSADRQK